MFCNRYSIIFVVKNTNAGAMSEWKIVKCKSSQLNDVIIKEREELAEKYNEYVYVNNITRL